MSDIFDNVIIHHGVKGMKWGVRKKRKALKDRNPNYKSSQVNYDQKVYGKRYSKKVNKMMNKGRTRAQAKDTLARRGKVRALALTAVAGLAYADYMTNGALHRGTFTLGKNFVNNSAFLQRASVSVKNASNGIKAVDKGYEVVQAMLSDDGVYRMVK